MNETASTIYMILFDWSTTDTDGIETFLYRNFEDARKHFNEMIENECDADLSWVGSEVFDENGDVNDVTIWTATPTIKTRKSFIGTSSIKTTITVIRLSTSSKKKFYKEKKI